MKMCKRCGEKPAYNKKSYCLKCLYVNMKTRKTRNKSDQMMEKEEFIKWYKNSKPKVTRYDLPLFHIER